MHKLPIVLGAALCAIATDTAASCGAAFCLVNTDWSAQGILAESGVQLDLRYEHIDLDQPRADRRRVAVGELPRHHDEVITRNRNWVASADWTLGPRWGLMASLPHVDRDHRHVHNHRGEKLDEAWSFRGIGDARLQVRYAFAGAAADAAPVSALGITAGLKLPTGKYDVANGEGALAERSLQAGSGTTDALLGAFWHRVSPLDSWSWFVRTQAVLPLNARDQYKPGRQLQLDAGLRYAAGKSLGLMLQANAGVRGRDRGANAEPEDSGQRALYLSPGASWNLGRDAQAYAFVQVPLYQSVNGVQLSADWSAMAGVSLRF